MGITSKVLDYIKTILCSIVCLCIIAIIVSQNNAMSDSKYQESRSANANMHAQEVSTLIDKQNSQVEWHIHYRR